MDELEMMILDRFRELTGIALPWLNDQPFRLRQLREVLRELADYREARAYGGRHRAPSPITPASALSS